MTCVPNVELDGLLKDHVDNKVLVKDTLLKRKRIDELKQTILYQDQHAFLLNTQISDQQTILAGYKKDYSDLQGKYNKSEKKATKRGKTALILVAVAIIEGVIIILK